MPSPARNLPADRYLTAALNYAADGWPVFLLGRRKRPSPTAALARPYAPTPATTRPPAPA
jgi:hypothetical protein